ncbi:MAG: type I restriction-modification system subunit M N-terminal domain-containing protein [Balneolaceae bacterium]|nr:type I restriction-modification system subunit M N-terminal domain-containing protein [Balneolaceae bacterium]
MPFTCRKHARYDYLLELPEKEDIGQKINEAMEAIEKENPELKDVLPQAVQEIWGSDSERPPEKFLQHW